MPTAITENKFADLKGKLYELFELDKSDLDFGIYRIMAAKNKEVTEFLDRQLKDVVRNTLAAHGAGVAEQAQTELDAAIHHAQELDADPDSLPKVKELKAKLAAAGGASAADLEADIYNHLLAFFSRYYDEGDFISKRRYKGDTYAIPYNGEEVTLYWANKDQYYIKSGEWHKDYRFKVGGKTVHFMLVEATQEAGNNKEPDDAKRRYILSAEKPLEVGADELALRFEFRPPTEAEKQAVAEATRIFGGNYDKPSSRTKGDEREQFCADAEQRALAALPAQWDTWRALVTAPAATEGKPARTLLGKQLDQFTARNTFDYFIHKDLGGFLKRELDFYIKNEVVRLDDLETLSTDHLAKVQGKLKAIRAVAGRVIDFLAAIENFQKKMWLKKKFVLETNWLVTVDRIPADLRNIVGANSKQWAEWDALGFKPTNGDATLLSGPKWGTREYLDANDKLVVDTRLFKGDYPDFHSQLLASDEVRAGENSTDSATVGTLIHGENFQAVALLSQVYRSAVDVVYIDPPYNTSENTFKYKNSYKHSSWAAMMLNRLEITGELIAHSGVLEVAIDDTETHRLRMTLDELLGGENRVTTITAEVNPAGQNLRPNTPALSHDYCHIYARSIDDTSMLLRELTETEMEQYNRSEGGGQYLWDNLRRRGGNSRPTDRPGQWFPLFLSANSVRVPDLTWEATMKQWVINEEPRSSETIVWPIDPKGEKRIWRVNPDGARKAIRSGDVSVIQKAGRMEVVKKSYMPEGKKPKTLWDDPKYSATTHGTKLLIKLLGKQIFSYPKSLYLVMDCLRFWADSDATALDYFAGSGTTGHAVVELNREDEGTRRFILVEMGAYFHTVLKPRIAKVLYSPEWEDGKAQVHSQGTSALVKYFALESYEDALNNLPAPTGELFSGADAATKDALITYSLDLELGPAMLNLDAFRDPWGYCINAQPAGQAEIKPHRVDLIETFNYLLGLRVHAYGPIDRYTADFAQAEHADNLGRLKVSGRLRRDAAGPFVFQRVEGELLDGTRILVIWRKVTDNPTQDAAVLDAWMQRHREDTRQRTEHRDYHQIYINGPVTLPQPTAEIRTVLPIEQTFKDRMFEDEKGG